MIEKLNELAEQAKKDEVYPSRLFPPSLYYRFLKRLAQWHKPRLSVEIGVCGGGGSLHLCQGYPQGKVVGVDYQWDHPEEVGYVQNTCNNFEFMLGDSVELAQEIYERNGLIDLMFVDTDHLYSRTILEWETYKPFLSDRAIVCFDDLLRHHPDDTKSMSDAWNDIQGNKHRIDYLHDGTYPHGGGFGIVWLNL